MCSSPTHNVRSTHVSVTKRERAPAAVARDSVDDVDSLLEELGEVRYKNP